MKLCFHKYNCTWSSTFYTKYHSKIKCQYNCSYIPVVAVYPECKETEWRCSNGQCIPRSAHQDWKQDCVDNSDEVMEGIDIFEYLGDNFIILVSLIFFPALLLFKKVC